MEKKYFVIHEVNGKNSRTEFETLLAARTFGIERYRSGKFIRLENQRGTLLPL